MARKKAKSEAPKKIKPISLNILEIAKRLQTLEQTSGGGDTSALANKSDIATEFNTTTAYTAGDFVYHDGKLYQFNADHAAGAWNPTDVVEANVTDQVASNKAAIDGLTASDVAYDNTTSGLTATTTQGAVDELADSYPATQVMLSDGVTSVEDALDENLTVTSGDATLTSGYFASGSYIKYKKQGKIVTLYVSLNAATTIAPSSVIGILPEEIRPEYAIAAASSASTTGIYAYTNGNIILLGAQLAANNWIYATLTYIL